MLAYKYRGGGDYLERDISTLLENCIYAAPFTTLNDPDEGRCNEAITRVLNLVDVVFKADTNHVRDALQKVRSFKDVIGIYSMSKTPFDNNMWESYADNHKGFCIEYDFEKLCEETTLPLKKDTNVLEVVYRDKFPTITLDDIYDEKKFMTKLYGTKLLKWEKEQEIRIIKDKYGEKAYHHSALKAIYFGENCEKPVKERIITALKGRDVKFYNISRNGTIISADFIVENKRNINRLNKDDFEVITRHAPTVENFNIIYKSENWTKQDIQNFIDLFRMEYATKQANIWIYDYAVDKSLLIREPHTLSNDEYNTMESHKIAE